MKVTTWLRTAVKYLLPVLMLCMFAATFSGCGVFKKKPAGGSAAPSVADTTLHKLSVSAYEIANALDSGEKEFEALYTSGLPGVSDDDYAKTVAGIFLKAQQANREYIGRLQTLSAIDTSNKAQVIAWSTEFIGSVQRLTDEGVLGIKNADARSKIQSLLSPIPDAINLIAEVLGIVLEKPTSTGPCTGACAFKFTEVKLGPEDRSRTYRPGDSDSREFARMDRQAQEGGWSYRRGSPCRGSEDQRPGRNPDEGFHRADERRAVRSFRELGFST